MKNSHVQFGFLLRPQSVAALFTICALLQTANGAYQLPYAAHSAGFTLHLPPSSSNLLQGGSIGPIYYGDSLTSLDLQHWELVIQNPNAGSISFNAYFVTPGGIFSGNLSMSPGSEVYLDIVYPDLTEVNQFPWSISGISDSNMSGSVLINTDVLEYPTLVNPIPGIVGAGTTSGAVFANGLVISGLPSITLTITTVPEPSLTALLGLWLSVLLTQKGRKD